MAVRCVVLFGHDGVRPAVARAPPVSVGPASGIGWHGLWQYSWGLVSPRKTRAMACASHAQACNGGTTQNTATSSNVTIDRNEACRQCWCAGSSASGLECRSLCSATDCPAYWSTQVGAAGLSTLGYSRCMGYTVHGVLTVWVLGVLSVLSLQASESVPRA
jgi:hypothetical protein